MKLRLKLLLPVVLYTLLAIGVTSFILLSAVSKKEGLQSESLALSEVGALSHSLQLYSLEIKKALLHAHLNQNVMEFGPFLALAKLDNTDLTYRVSKFYSRTNKIKESVFKSKIQDMPLAMAGIKNQLSFHMMSYSQKSPYLLAFLNANNTILVGFLKPHDLSSLLDSRQSPKHQIYVLANKVYAIAHPDKKYLGVNMDNHPLSRLALASKHQSGVKTYQTELGHKDIVSFDYVEGTNLTVGVSHSLAGGLVLPYLSFTETLVALILLLAAGWASFTMARIPLETKIREIKSLLQKIIKGEPFDNTVYFANDGGGFAPIFDLLEERLNSQNEFLSTDSRLGNMNKQDIGEQDKKDIFRNLSLTLASSFQRPLGVVLGHLQMAKVESEKALIDEKIDLAQMDVRKLRAKLDDLNKAVSDQKPTLSPLLLMDCLSDLIREKVDIFNQKGVKITKNLNVKKYVRTHQLNLEKSLSLIIDFFISTFAEQIHREMQFDLIDGRNELIFKITSNAAELEVEDIERCLDPFREQTSHFGDNLSLAIANSIIKNLDGVIKVESLSDFEDPRGIVFKIFIPLASDREIEDYFASREFSENNSLKASDEQVAANFVAETLGEDETFDQKASNQEDITNDVSLKTDSFSGFHYQEDLAATHVKVSSERSLEEDCHENYEGVDLSSAQETRAYETDDPKLNSSSPEQVEACDEEYDNGDRDDDDRDDFVMLKPPRASDIPPPHMEVTDPFQSVTLKKLKDQNPILNEEIVFPTPPVSTSITSLQSAEAQGEIAAADLKVKIRKPKVRGGH